MTRSFLFSTSPGDDPPDRWGDIVSRNCMKNDTGIID